MSSVTSYDPPNRWWVALSQSGLLIQYFSFDVALPILRYNSHAVSIHDLQKISDKLCVRLHSKYNNLQRIYKSKDNFCVLYVLYIVLIKFWFQIFSKLFNCKNFQVIAAFLARHYRNQLDPDEKAARAVFPRQNYLY